MYYRSRSRSWTGHLQCPRCEGFPLYQVYGDFFNTEIETVGKGELSVKEDGGGHLFSFCDPQKNQQSHYMYITHATMQGVGEDGLSTMCSCVGDRVRIGRATLIWTQECAMRTHKKKATSRRIYLKHVQPREWGSSATTFPSTSTYHSLWSENAGNICMWDGSPAAGKSLCHKEGTCGGTPRWVVRVSARSGVSNEDNLRVPPRSLDSLEGL